MKKLLLIVLFLCTIIGIKSQGNLNYNSWEKISVVDEFGDVTGDTVSRIFCKGTFSNSATSNSLLIVKIIKYPSKIYHFSMFEYGKAPLEKHSYKSVFSKCFYIKDESGTKHTFEVLFNESGGFSLHKKEYDNLENVLNSNKILKCYLQYNRSSYRFDINQSINN